MSNLFFLFTPVIPIGYQQGIMVRKKQNKILFGALHKVTPSK